MRRRERQAYRAPGSPKRSEDEQRGAVAQHMKRRDACGCVYELHLTTGGSSLGRAFFFFLRALVHVPSCLRLRMWQAMRARLLKQAGWHTVPFAATDYHCGCFNMPHREACSS